MEVRPSRAALVFALVVPAALALLQAATDLLTDAPGLFIGLCAFVVLGTVTCPFVR